MSDVKNAIEQLQENRNAILFIELAGLLHDIGKLSKVFLKYRQEWHDIPDGYNKDPHDRSYFDKDKTLNKKEYSTLLNLFSTETPKSAILGDASFTIKSAVHNHTDLAASKIEKMLKAADGIDAAFDRNNPLWSAEQRTQIFDSNVFGYEDRLIDIDEQDKLRDELYKDLDTRLPEYFANYGYGERLDVLEAIKKQFEQGLSDTTRPQNDTNLWEHSYAVASILKSLTVHNLFSAEENHIEYFPDVRFGILGVGWDGMRFMTYGEKIGDILGRKAIIDRIKDGIKYLIEYKYPIGNEIYSDDNGIYFIVPAELEDTPLSEVWSAVKDSIFRMAADISLGELQPAIKLHSPMREYTDSKGRETKNKGVKALTGIIAVIQDLECQRNYPFDATRDGFHYFAQALASKIEDAKSVCPVCRFRPVQREDRRRKICAECEGRRRDAGKALKGLQEERNVQEDKAHDKKKDAPTVFIDEIKDGNSQAALIVARFGLDEWVNGRMIRSLFVTEAHGIKNEIDYLRKVEQFKTEELAIQAWFDKKGSREYTYQRIKDDVDALIRGTDQDRARNVRFLYDRRALYDRTTDSYTLFGKLDETKKNLNQLWKDADKEHTGITLYNVINAKTPTPSTILDVWDTTTRFFEDFKQGIVADDGILPQANRLCLIVEETVKDYGAREAEVEGIGRVEVIALGENKLEVIGERHTEKSSEKWAKRGIKILDGPNQHVKTVSNCEKGTLFQPYRDITVSPNLFMAYVPADKVLEITRRMYEQYIERFGKVAGRLPFSIGNIFFKKDMPMFVVLDAAKRMIANFDKVAQKEETFSVLQKTEAADKTQITIKGKLGALKRTVAWSLPSRLGDGNPDFYHPYLIVDGSPSDRKTFFETVAGNVVHFNGIRKNDRLKLYLNYYDYEFLDANARRYEVAADDKDRRCSSVGNFKSKPYLLDDLLNCIIPLWEHLLKGRQLSGITDTKLRNMQSLWLTKYAQWDVKLGEATNDNYRQWLHLVTSTICNEFPKIDNVHKTLLEETVQNGVFFDTLEIYLGILKDKIGQ